MSDPFSEMRPVVIVISRTDVEAANTGGTLEMLRTFVERATQPSQVRGRLALAFHGYDTDPRELWQVPEVRTFVRSLDEAFPYWLYLVDLGSDCLKMIAFCLCRVTTPMRGATAVNPTDLQVFLEGHFEAMNQMLDHWRVSEEENAQVTEEVATYFTRSTIAN